MRLRAHHPPGKDMDMEHRPDEIPSQFETERLIVRRYHLSDDAAYLAAGLRNVEHLGRFESDNSLRKIKTQEDSRKLLGEYLSAWNARRYFMYGAFDKPSGAFTAQIYVGVVSWTTPEFEVGYVADVDHVGQGLVTEAVKGVLKGIFESLNAHRVRIECSDSNPRSAHVAERCGFVREGHIRENRREADGSLTGTYHFGLLRSEYDSLKENNR